MKAGEFVEGFLSSPVGVIYCGQFGHPDQNRAIIPTMGKKPDGHKVAKFRIRSDDLSLPLTDFIQDASRVRDLRGLNIKNPDSLFFCQGRNRLTFADALNMHLLFFFDGYWEPEALSYIDTSLIDNPNAELIEEIVRIPRVRGFLGSSFPFTRECVVFHGAVRVSPIATTLAQSGLQFASR